MALALVLALQAALGAPAAASPIVAIDFDLARVRSDERWTPGGACRRGDPSTIVVCARRSHGGDYPMEAMERLYGVRPLLAEKQLGPGTVGRIYGEQVPMGRGAVSNRILIGVRTSF